MQQKPEICLKNPSVMNSSVSLVDFQKKCFWIVRKMNSWTTLNKVATCEANVRGNQIFTRSENSPGILAI